MKLASDTFTDEQTKQINDAVVEAESHTSAEIVPVVTTASGRYDRPEDIVGLWFALLAAAIAWLVVPATRAADGSWGGTSPVWQLVAILGAIVVGFAVGAVTATRAAWLRRLCTPPVQMRDEVHQTARAVFFDRRIQRTAGATGLLLYVSLYERLAVVIADDTVTETLGQDALNEICSELTGKLRSEDMTAAICETLVSAGQRLGEALPRQDNDVNELPDTLVILD